MGGDAALIQVKMTTVVDVEVRRCTGSGLLPASCVVIYHTRHLSTKALQRCSSSAPISLVSPYPRSAQYLIEDIRPTL